MTDWFPFPLSSVLRALVEHIDLCLIALTIGSVIAFPAGLLLARCKWLADLSLTALGMLYTVPSLAMLAVLVPVLGLGKGSAIVALVIYAQFILLRNVLLGLRSIDPASLEAARGLGLTSWQIFRMLEAPMAMPTWVSGLRNATLSTLSTATVAAWINAGGLGALIFEGLSQNNPSKILVGAVLISGLALLFDFLLRTVEQESAQIAKGLAPEC